MRSPCKRNSSQLALNLQGGRTKLSHGGRRRGAGRPNRSGLQAHVRRPRLKTREPVHVTLRLVDGLPSLRRKEAFLCLRDAVRKARAQGFAVSHFAILSNHIHLILEPSAPKLGRIFQSFGISFAKRLNALLDRAGPVFRERYHMHVLRTPAEVRHALAYVLTNRERHACQGRPPTSFTVCIDLFSSAYAFRDWRALFGSKVDFEFSGWPEDEIERWHGEILAPMKTWLLKSGWKRVG